MPTLLRLPAGLTTCLALALLLAPAAALAKRQAPVACDPGTFALAAGDQQTLGALLGGSVDAFTLGPANDVTLGPCAAAAKVKPKRRATGVTAHFPACGAAIQAKLVVKMAAPDCSVALGTLHAKHVKRIAFTALRVPGLPAPACGNGVRDAGEACEGLDGCDAGVCTAACTCESAPVEPSTSQGLIADALAAGTIDLPTSLLYRAYALFGDSRLPPAYDGEQRRGEDEALFLEASRDWGSLSPDARAALEPFMVRPTDPKSIYFPAASGLRVRRAAGATSLADLKCPYAPNASFPDWRATESAHFVVWSCGGGDLGQDPDATLRTIVGSVADQAWDAITPEAAVPRPDDFASGPAPQDRIDIYILRGADCRDRQGVCAPIETDASGQRPLAAVIPAPPCDRAVNGALTSSAYMLVDRDSVTASPVGPWLFRYVLAHEFFHVVSNAMNLEAQGAGCFDPSAGATTIATSWLSEASAEWAAWAFFAGDGPGERTKLFTAFQELRPPKRVSLLSVEEQRPYEAFLYPFFVQQEKGGSRTPFLEMWKGSASARKPEDLDGLLDSVLPFEEHFRDFTVRNFNSTTELPASERHYQGQDAAIPVNEKPTLIEPTLELVPPATKISVLASLQPLTAQYQRYRVDDLIRYVRIDAGGLANGAFVDLDALADVRGSWERRKGTGGVLEFCRDDAADDVQELYLVVTNRDRRRGQQVSGAYTVETRTTCPSGWTGYVKYVLTIDDVGEYADANISSSRDDHLRTEDVWTFVSTTPAGSPDEYDVIETAWHGSYSNTALDTSIPTHCIGYETESESSTSAGSGTGSQQFSVIPGDPDPAGIALVQLDFPQNEMAWTGTDEGEQCNIGHFAHTFSGTWSAGIGQLQAGLGLATPLQPDANDADHYAGRFQLDHDVHPGLGNGTNIYDDYVEWDFRRHRAH